MNIAPEKMLFVAGYKKSSTLRLQIIDGVKITLPAKGGSEISIEGPAVKVYSAQKEIAESLPEEVSFVVEKDYIDLVLRGRRAMWKSHNAVVNIDGEGMVLIRAKKSECEVVKEAIESMIDDKKKSEAYKEIFFVAGDQMAHLFGGEDGFNLFKTTESTYNISLSFDVSQSEITGFDILVKGPVAESVYAAKKAILDNLPCTLALDVDERFIGRILGRKGEKLRRLQKDFGVEIVLEDGVAYISGMKGRTEAAKDAIFSIMIFGKRTKAAGGATTPSNKQKRTSGSATTPINKRKKTVAATPA